MARKIVTVKAKRADGFWRCGVFHPAKPVQHPAGRFTAQEIARLKAEPLLEVTVLDDAEVVERGEQAGTPKAAAAGKAAGKGKRS
jgi:hypothetical protein